MKYLALSVFLLGIPLQCLGMDDFEEKKSPPSSKAPDQEKSYEETRTLPHTGQEFVDPTYAPMSRKSPSNNFVLKTRLLPVYSAHGALWKVRDGWTPYGRGLPQFPEDYKRIKEGRDYEEHRIMAWNGKEYIAPGYEVFPGNHKIGLPKTETTANLGLGEKTLPTYAAHGRIYRVKDGWLPNIKGNPQFPQDYVPASRKFPQLSVTQAF